MEIERPKCRNVVEDLVARGYALNELANPCDETMQIWEKRGLIGFVCGTAGLQSQINKMQKEELVYNLTNSLKEMYGYLENKKKKLPKFVKDYNAQSFEYKIKEMVLILEEMISIKEGGRKR